LGVEEVGDGGGPGFHFHCEGFDEFGVFDFPGAYVEEVGAVVGVVAAALVEFVESGVDSGGEVEGVGPEGHSGVSSAAFAGLAGFGFDELLVEAWCFDVAAVDVGLDGVEELADGFVEVGFGSGQVHRVSVLAWWFSRPGSGSPGFTVFRQGVVPLAPQMGHLSGIGGSSAVAVCCCGGVAACGADGFAAAVVGSGAGLGAMFEYVPDFDVALAA
jgi:hypothetical protein